VGHFEIAPSFFFRQHFHIFWLFFRKGFKIILDSLESGVFRPNLRQELLG